MMGKTILVSDLLKLSVSERIQLVEDVWDSVAHFPEAVPLTEGQKKVLDQRLEAYRKNPSGGSPWTDVRNKFISKG